LDNQIPIVILYPFILFALRKKKKWIFLTRFLEASEEEKAQYFLNSDIFKQTSNWIFMCLVFLLNACEFNHLRRKICRKEVSGKK